MARPAIVTRSQGPASRRDPSSFFVVASRRTPYLSNAARVRQRRRHGNRRSTARRRSSFRTGEEHRPPGAKFTTIEKKRARLDCQRRWHLTAWLALGAPLFVLGRGLFMKWFVKGWWGDDLQKVWEREAPRDSGRFAYMGLRHALSSCSGDRFTVPDDRTRCLETMHRVRFPALHLPASLFVLEPSSELDCWMHWRLNFAVLPRSPVPREKVSACGHLPAGIFSPTFST